MGLAVFAFGLLRFALTAVLAVLVVFVTYRVFIRANTDFDEELEIRKGNVSVGVLVAALLVASANIIHQALEPLLNLVSSRVAQGSAADLWRLGLYSVAHLALAFGLAVLTISLALRVFGRLTRKAMRMGAELERGNMAVGVVLAGVVFVVSLYIGQGINALSRAAIPQPGSSRIRVMR